MSREENKSVLQYFMFLKQNWCGKIKGKGCIDGRKQIDYLAKYKTSAPTIATAALFLPCLIDTNENCYVATLNVPGEIMQSGI